MLITSNFNISLNSSGNDFSIHVGEVKESEMGSKGQRLSVAEVIAHENYRGISNSFSNGIALLMLSSKAIFNDFVRPACIGTNTHGVMIIALSQGGDTPILKTGKVSIAYV